MNKIVMSHDEILKASKKIGKSISKELSKEKRIPVVVGVMKGATNFMMDLIKYITPNIYIDYIQVSSYNGTTTTGKVILQKDLTFDIKNRTVVLVEDVVDTGISMSYLLDFLKDRYKPKRIILVALFDKKFRRKKKVKIDYAGKVLTGDDFLYGYGLDYMEVGRNLPDVYALNEKDVHELNKKIKAAELIK